MQPCKLSCPGPGAHRDLVKISHTGCFSTCGLWRTVVICWPADACEGGCIRRTHHSKTHLDSCILSVAAEEK